MEVRIVETDVRVLFPEVCFSEGRLKGDIGMVVEEWDSQLDTWRKIELKVEVVEQIYFILHRIYRSG